MPQKAWIEEAESYLRMRWSDGAAAELIASELTVRFGHTYTSAAVSVRASKLRLPRRGLDTMGDAGAAQARMLKAGMTYREISDSTGESYVRVCSRGRAMISYGLVDRHPAKLHIVPIDDEIPETLAVRIRRLRLARVLTQRALADLIECRPELIARWESGVAVPQPSRHERLAAALGVSQALLMTGREHPLYRAIRATSP